MSQQHDGDGAATAPRDPTSNEQLVLPESFGQQEPALLEVWLQSCHLPCILLAAPGNQTQQVYTGWDRSGTQDVSIDHGINLGYKKTTTTTKMIVHSTNSSISLWRYTSFGEYQAARKDNVAVNVHTRALAYQ